MPIFTESHGPREKALYPWEDLAHHPPLPQARIPAQIRKRQAPKRKNALIEYDLLRGLLGLKSYAFALAVILLIVFGKKLTQLLTEFMWRLRSGATIKIASVELGPIVVASGQEVSQREK